MTMFLSRFDGLDQTTVSTITGVVRTAELTIAYVACMGIAPTNRSTATAMHDLLRKPKTKAR